MAFNRVYANNNRSIGFDCAGNTWLRAELCKMGVFIDKFYGGSEPCLSFKQARKFAEKIIKWCDENE